jgi:hypothetical protein
VAAVAPSSTPRIEDKGVSLMNTTLGLLQLVGIGFAAIGASALQKKGHEMETMKGDEKTEGDAPNVIPNGEN